MILFKNHRFAAIPRNAATRDHFEPRTYGGKNQYNLVAACRQCNQLRDEMDAIAFYNLVKKWFRRFEGLWERWHELSKEELQTFRRLRLESQQRQLHGLGVMHIEFAFRHFRLITLHGHELRA
jgi:hypothetical protein